MAFEIEITVGYRTYHYATLAAYRDDMEKRTLRIRALNSNLLKANVTPERKTELGKMLRAEIAEHEAIMQGAYDIMKAEYTCGADGDM